jgi:hypothetical protein
LSVSLIFFASGVFMITIAAANTIPIMLLGGLCICLAGYSLFWRWVADNKYRSEMLWFLERVRRCLAGDGDPGRRML